MKYTVELSEEQLKDLIQRARCNTGPESAAEEGEDYIAMDYSGGNFDDAYSNGVSDGDIEAAREVLDLIGVEWKQHE